jgi:hypothetical protein
MLPSRLFVVRDGSGRRYAVFVEERATMLTFQTHRAAHLFSRVLERRFVSTGHYPILEILADGSVILDGIPSAMNVHPDQSMPNMLDVVEESGWELHRECCESMIDYMIIRDIQIDDHDFRLQSGIVLRHDWANLDLIRSFLHRKVDI